MKPKHIKEQREKEVRGIQEKQWEISTKIRNLGYIKLAKPIRHGWFKEIVITSNIDRYRNKKHILELYDIIEKRFWGRTKEKADKQWFHQVSKYLIYKDFPTISKKQFNRLTPKAQAMCTIYQYRDCQKKLRKRFYVRIPKNAYRIKYTRAYITHSKKIDPLLESQSALLEQQLLKQKYYKVDQKLHGWSSKDIWSVPQTKKDKLKVKKQLKYLKNCLVEDVVKDKILWEKN